MPIIDEFEILLVQKRSIFFSQNHKENIDTESKSSQNVPWSVSIYQHPYYPCLTCSHFYILIKTIFLYAIVLDIICCIRYAAYHMHIIYSIWFVLWFQMWRWNRSNEMYKLPSIIYYLRWRLTKCTMFLGGVPLLMWWSITS